MAFGNYHNVTGAGWSVYWRIPTFNGSGLEVWWADFQGHRVMWRGSAPFAIVPYHHPNTNGEPPGPHFSYKDGNDTQCGGASFRALKHGAPNSGAPWTTNVFDAANDTDAVVVTVMRWVECLTPSAQRRPTSTISISESIWILTVNSLTTCARSLTTTA